MARGGEESSFMWGFSSFVIPQNAGIQFLSRHSREGGNP